MTLPSLRRALLLLSLPVLLAGAWALWQHQQQSARDEFLISGNGRLEATEIDVASKLPGRIAQIAVNEGDIVEPGQLLASMDTRSLEAQQHQAEAQRRQSETAILTARAQVTQRESQQRSAEALVVQRQAELSAAEKRYRRSEALVQSRAISRQQLDDDLAARQQAAAALSAARAQVQAEQAAVEVARSQVLEAESAALAVRATLERLQADLEDSQLKSDRTARVQYRIAQPGEVLGAGGKLLNLVDLSDVYMTFFLPERVAGRVAIGSEARLILDAAPHYVIPAQVSYVASVAQFTPKMVETASEREKMMFRVKARIDPALLRQHREQVKTGLPGVAWLKLDEHAEWPAHLQIGLQP